MTDEEIIQRAEARALRFWKANHQCGARYRNDCTCSTCDGCGSLEPCDVDAEGDRLLCGGCQIRFRMDRYGNINEKLWARR